MNDRLNFQEAQIEALQKENKRLNDELIKFKNLAFKVRLSDPIFDKPLSKINVEYEIIKK